MFDNDEKDKLEKILRLKKELEEDLKKKGLLKEKPKETKESKYDEETVKRLKESMVSTAHISEDESLTFFDINANDYDASIDTISKTLTIFAQRTKNINYKFIFEGLISLLKADFKRAVNLFEQAKGIESIYNKLLAQLYMGQDITQDAINFLKSYPESTYPLILLLEKELIRGSAENLQKIIALVSKKSEFWNLIYNLFIDSATEENVSKAIRENKFAPLIVLLNAYLDYTKDIPIQNNVCLNVHRAYMRGESVNAPAWCPFGQLIFLARKYLSGYKLDFQSIRKFEKSPEFKLFIGFYHYNEKNYPFAREYFKAFETQVGTYTILTKPLKQPRVGIEQFTTAPKDFTYEKYENMPIIDFLSQNPGYDVYVNYRKFEFLRLVFSEEHCSINYR
ncbi:MAG: hypothetical protein ACP5KD_02010 [Fervidobacterium sp.]